MAKSPGVVVRLDTLKAICSVAEGAVVPDAACAASKEAATAAAVLRDRSVFSVLGGRDGAPRSLRSIFAASVVRFLGGVSLATTSRCSITLTGFAMPGGVVLLSNNAMLLFADYSANVLRVIRATDGAQLRAIGKAGHGPLQFLYVRQLYVARDGAVFVADSGNNRVQILTPALDFDQYLGEGYLYYPNSVCADAEAVVVADCTRIHVFHRASGLLLRTFSGFGTVGGLLNGPRVLTFLHGHRHVAISDGDKVSVFTLDGEFCRLVGAGVIASPHELACSAWGELVVVDYRRRRVAVFDSDGAVIATAAIRRGRTNGKEIAVHAGIPLVVDIYECFREVGDPT
jgi:DNA-binding beta-propeller fold protein YncE